MPGTGSHDQRVTILMAVRDGARYLPAQLDSIAAQSLDGWRLLASDDGSTDESRALIDRFAATHPQGRVLLLTGPGQGPAANFRHLLRAVPENGGLVAFGDQDDVWLPDKLERAARALAGLDGPAIWCSSVTICDEALRPLAVSTLPRRGPSFRHALVQNLVRGNTLVLNPAAFRLTAAADAETGPVVMHDWWIYQLVTGAGGRVIFDPRPSVLYRQHGANVVGGARGLRARLTAAGRLVLGAHRGWSRRNLLALHPSRHRLTPENRRVLDDFARLQDPLPQRIAALRRGGFHRQGRLEQLALWAAVLLGRA
ncbi:glycosyltransferase family 2 protein [uncultured Paracoccus sp.]|uniref:glycosyltransferase family 2 protein n=1 Tax=uncultured Paracoccus sp. TaxID=189685 RepID=UPI0025F80ED1|nr:glycosyltransferase family 2 protein [uncultured Paracoccus sp.]